MDDILNKMLKLLSESEFDQKDFANKIGVKPQVVSDWKAGRNKSYTKYLNQIAEYFGVTTDYLLGREENNDKHDSSPQKKRFGFKGEVKITPVKKNTPDEEVRSVVIEKVNNLSNSQLDRLLGYIEALSEDINK